MSASPAMTQRPTVFVNARLVDPASDERLQSRPLRGGTEGVEPTILEIWDARREPETQKMA